MSTSTNGIPTAEPRKKSRARAVERVQRGRECRWDPRWHSRKGWGPELPTTKGRARAPGEARRGGAGRRCEGAVVGQRESKEGGRVGEMTAVKRATPR